MQAFMTIPFRRSELELQKQQSGRDYLYGIEGFIYNPSLHGLGLHGGIDYYCDYCTEVFSPIDGYVMSSYNFARGYQQKDLKSTSKHRCYREAKLSYGLGYSIQLYCPIRDLFLLYGHFSYLSSTVPYTPPKLTQDERGNDMWSCSGFALTRELRDQIDQVPRAKKIRQGSYLGTTGLSGLYIGRELPSKEDVSDKPRKKIEYSEFNKNYTNPHLHMNIFSRNNEGSRATPFDPYDIYSRSEDYPTNERGGELGDSHIMKLGDRGKVLFVDDPTLYQS